ALSWKFISLKYSVSVNNKTFGVPDSRGSSYLDLTASYDVIEKVNDVIGKVTVFGHYGHQWYHGNPNGFDNGNFDYGDWKVGASTEIWGLTVGIYGTGTNAQDAFYTNIYGKNIAKNQFVGYVQKTF
ncbi:MAG TPA: TorF family putative porin, partial [Casimicrobiaceae bacterium]|nr:TorF family putative porin [Casimicrobiaceae bacterium]